MNPKIINWLELKEKDYLRWKDTLIEKTLALLKSSGMLELTQLNEIGCFHRVRDGQLYEKMKQESETSEAISETWISKGDYPGIWTALFDPYNTFSFSIGTPHIIRFYFKDGFYLYDKYSGEHQRMWEGWRSKGDSNPWSELLNDSGVSLEERMRTQGLPHQRQFYTENRFGAVIGYSDYISVIIILPESVKRVEFFDL